MTNRKRTKYWEGQWFAVPLDKPGFALGIIVWGSYRTKCALGYFFGPKLDVVPPAAPTDILQPSNAVLIQWFYNSTLTYSEWPLLQSIPEFSRAEWPIPQFGSIDLLAPNLGWLVTYDQSLSTGDSDPDSESTRVHCYAEEILGLPQEGMADSGYVRGILTDILVRGRTHTRIVTRQSDL